LVSLVTTLLRAPLSSSSIAIFNQRKDKGADSMR
jgi:hypothetical protein